MKQRAKRLLAKFDLDDSGALEFREFRAALEGVLVGYSEADFALIFEAFDADGSGAISTEEFAAAIAVSAARRGASSASSYAGDGRGYVEYLKVPLARTWELPTRGGEVIVPHLTVGFEGDSNAWPLDRRQPAEDSAWPAAKRVLETTDDRGDEEIIPCAAAPTPTPPPASKEALAREISERAVGDRERDIRYLLKKSEQQTLLGRKKKKKTKYFASS